jgi:hypothetical protein
MADTTTRYGFPFQEATDPPDGAAVGQDLAEAVDTALGSVEDAADTRLDAHDTRLDTLEVLDDREDSVLPQGVIKRGRRTTSTGNVTTTETGVLRVDDIPVYAGRLYKISTSNINVDTSADNDVARAAIRVSTSGAATTSSTLIGYVRMTIDNNTQSNVHNVTCFYSPGSDGDLSVLLTLLRQAGSGNIIVFGGASDICDLVIEDMGPDPGDTGVVI